MLLLLLASQNGCATFFDSTGHHIGGDGPRIYGGVRFSFEVFAQYHRHVEAVVFLLLDFPFSVMADTILLPITVPYELSREPDEVVPKDKSP
jgi:uncharacterized protein YceK